MTSPKFGVEKPPRWAGVVICATLVLLWGWIRLALFPQFIMPLTFLIPMMVCVWTRDKACLWGMALCFLAMISAQIFWVMPRVDHHDWVQYVATAVNIVVGAFALHLVLALRDRLDSSLSDLRASKDEITAQSEELAQQNEELMQQGEELNRQNEELEVQHEELRSQTEEIQATNSDLSRREKMLQRLLDSARSFKGERQVMDEICQTALDLMGGAAEAAIVLEPQGEFFAVSASAGGVSADLSKHPVDGSFAGLVLRQNKTASLENVADRPDIAIFDNGPDPFLSALASPVRLNGRPTAVVSVYSRRPQQWTTEDFRFAEWLAAQCSQVLEVVRLQKDLSDREARLRQIIESLPQMVWTCLPDGSCDYVSPQWVAYTGRPEQEQLGRGWLDQLHPDDRGRVESAWRSAVDSNSHFAIEFRVCRHDGAHRWFRTSAVPFCDEGGRVVKWFGSSTDIQDAKEAEEERVQLIRSLDEQARAAEAANQAKSQFLANMSHELRTPMNAILGMIDVALPKAENPTVRDCLDTARESADLLLKLLNDLLDSARIESGKLELESVPFSIRKILDRTTTILCGRASEKGLSFCCRVPEGIPNAVVGDGNRLQQILVNLAGNAIKFTEHGGVEICLDASSREGRASLQFSVRDTGIGIPPSRLEQIFQPFAQADASMSRRFGGTGLGLPISKSLVEMMGGRIWAESEVGKGSAFYFTIQLPLADGAPSDSSNAPAIKPEISRRLRILLVEDNPANQKLATYVLTERGHEIDLAGDGREAIRMARLSEYDVIVIDVQMPGMDGFETTAAIRRLQVGSRRVPIIAMTAHAMKGDRERCLKAGMDGYLAKPVDAREMIALVEDLAGDATPELRSAESPPDAGGERPGALQIFNAEDALARCFNSEKMVHEMIKSFLDESGEMFAQMRSSLEKGDLKQVGRVGHRIKGTVVYLGAEAAKDAAGRVERFYMEHGSPAQAKEAVDALERECETLKKALEEFTARASAAQTFTPAA